jgi:amidase
MKITRDRTPICEVSDGRAGLLRPPRRSAARFATAPRCSTPPATPSRAIPSRRQAKDGPYLADVEKSPGKLRIAWSVETPQRTPDPR